MRGILEGMGLTFSHLFRPKVTRLYPYEKPKLPPRSRGLIQLIAEEGLQTEFNLKCESCLLCEKACPPRAITIEYEPLDEWKTRPGSNHTFARALRSLHRARFHPLRAHQRLVFTRRASPNTRLTTLISPLLPVSPCR